MPTQDAEGLVSTKVEEGSFCNCHQYASNNVSSCEHDFPPRVHMSSLLVYLTIAGKLCSLHISDEASSHSKVPAAS